MQQINRRAVLAAGAAGVGLFSTRSAQAQQNSDYAASKAPNGQLARRGEYVIRNAFLLTMDNQLGEIPSGDVHVRDGVIVAIGPNLNAPQAEVINGADTICMPGFVDTHWHLWVTNCRQWLRTDDIRYDNFPVTTRIGARTTPLDAYRTARYALADGILSGVTTLNNFCHNTRGPEWADAELSAMRDMGIRGRFSYGGPQQGRSDQPMDLAGLARTKKEWFTDPLATDGRLSLGICSRNLVSGQSLRSAITYDIAKRDWGGARELGLPITLHASPANLVFELEKNNLLGPDVELFHPMFTVAEERAILKSRGTSFCCAPVGEAQRPRVDLEKSAGKGITPEGGEIQLNELLHSGVQCGFGIDETVAGNTDFFNIMRMMYKYDRHRLGYGERNLLTTKRLLQLSTIEGAKVLGLEKSIGSLTVGKRADLILVSTDDFNTAPSTNPWDTLVLHAHPRNVTMVMADGRVLAKDGKLTSVDRRKLLSDIRETNARLAPFADPA